MTAIWLLIRALLGGALKRAGELLRWMFDHPLQTACAGLALWAAWLMIVTIPARDAALAKTSEQLHAEKTAHATTRTNYASAQLIAQDMARQQQATFERRYKELATNADVQFASGRASALAAADRYIAAHRLPVGTGGIGGASGATTASAPDRSASSSDGPGAAAQLVAVTADDLQICTTNTARLLEVRKWGLGLAAAAE